MTTQYTWPFQDTQDDGSISVNQRMVHHLLRRQGVVENRSMMALGIEVAELREEVGMGVSELAILSGLDRGFLIILEAGKALPAEITETVLVAVAVGLNEYHPVDRTLIYLDRARSP